MTAVVIGRASSKERREQMNSDDLHNNEEVVIKGSMEISQEEAIEIVSSPDVVAIKEVGLPFDLSDEIKEIMGISAPDGFRILVIHFM